MNASDHPDHDPRETTQRGGEQASLPGRSEAALQRIGQALHGLRYGSVLAIVQDGIVVQIERTEKSRFPR
jgi:hypothetical protein